MEDCWATGYPGFVPLDGAVAGGLKILLQLHFLSFDLGAALDECDADDWLAISIGFAAVGAAAGGQADGAIMAREAAAARALVLFLIFMDFSFPLGLPRHFLQPLQ